MEITKPIFIVGAGRSRSTVFHDIFAEHRGVAWMSSLCGSYPDRLWRHRLHQRAIDWPMIGPLARRKWNPSETYEFWERYCHGFRRPCRDLLPGDVTLKTKRQFQRIAPELLSGPRNRLLVRITGWPRIGFFNEIFPDGRYVHVLRDGRAVAWSLMNIHFWWGWGGPEKWRWGALTPEQQAEWERHDRSFLALAAIQWKIMLDAMEKAKSFIPADQFLEITYEDLCEDAVAVFRKVCDFCELDWTPQFEARVRSFNMRNTNDKYKKDLTPEQQAILEDVLAEYLEQYGYR